MYPMPNRTKRILCSRWATPYISSLNLSRWRSEWSCEQHPFSAGVYPAFEPRIAVCPMPEINSDYGDIVRHMWGSRYKTDAADRRRMDEAMTDAVSLAALRHLSAALARKTAGPSDDGSDSGGEDGAGGAGGRGPGWPVRWRGAKRSVASSLPAAELAVGRSLEAFSMGLVVGLGIAMLYFGAVRTSMWGK
jgi:hypothetical protein